MVETFTQTGTTHIAKLETSSTGVGNFELLYNGGNDVTLLVKVGELRLKMVN